MNPGIAAAGVAVTNAVSTEAPPELVRALPTSPPTHLSNMGEAGAGEDNGAVAVSTGTLVSPNTPFAYSLYINRSIILTPSYPVYGSFDSLRHQPVRSFRDFGP